MWFSFCPCHYLSYWSSLFSWGRSSAYSSAPGVDRLMVMSTLMSRQSGIGRLTKSPLCSHPRQCSWVSLLKLVKPIRVAPDDSQDSQAFSTPWSSNQTYRVIKIVHIIGQSVNDPKRLYTNHKSKIANFGCNHAS